VLGERRAGKSSSTPLRSALAGSAFAFALASAPALAGVHGGLIVPNPPPVPRGPVAAQLNDAYRAVIGATSPYAALDADAAYVQALQAAARGDRAGALAAAAAAQARAIEGSALGTPLQALPLPLTAQQLPAAELGHPSDFAPTGTTPPAHNVPIVATGAGGDHEIGMAQSEIAIAQAGVAAGSRLLDLAKTHYRAALDAYYDGNAAKANAEARTALELARDVITTRK